MNRFRIVVLDHAKLQLENPIAKKLLADMIVTKQQNFERTNESFITIDKNDMLGSHILIYSTEDIFNPKLVFTVRITYQDRAEKSKVKTPVQELYPVLGLDCQAALNKFLKRYPSLVECNSLFLEPEYSAKRIGIQLTDIGFVVACSQLMSLGYNYFVGCPNSRYKTHRFVENFGDFPQNYEFIHPVIPHPHMLVMMENFNLSYIWSIYNKYKEIFDSIMWVCPDQFSCRDFGEFIKNSAAKFGKSSVAA